MKIDTMAKKVQDNLKKEIPEVYPQRYVGYTVNSINYNVILSDIETYWNTEARFREGFSADDTNKIITIPNFFTKINGIYKNKKQYIHLIEMLRSSANTITMKYKKNDGCKITLVNELTEKIDKDSIFPVRYLDTEKYTFSVEPTIQNVLSGNIYCFKIDTSTNFNFEYLTSDKKQLLLDSIDKIIKNNLLNFKDYHDFKDFLSMALSLDMEYVTMINNFDYGLFIPKIVYYDENIKKIDAWKLYLFNEMGIDIVIISPSGKSNIEKYIDITNISLGYYDSKFNLNDEVIVKEDKKEKELKQKQKIKSFCSGIFELISPRMILFIFLGCVAIAFGYIFHLSGTTNTIIQVLVCIFWGFIFSCLLDGTFDNENTDFPILVYFIAIVLVVLVLVARFISYDSLDETNTIIYNGFLNIEEDFIENDDFVIHQREDAVMEDGHSVIHCYIENSSKNSFDIRFEIWVNNTKIYTSKKMSQMSYVKQIRVQSYLPVGDNEITVKYYNADDYKSNGENKSIGEKNMIVHVVTEDMLEDNMYGYEDIIVTTEEETE